MNTANSQQKIIFRKNKCYVLWLNQLAIIRPSYKNSKRGYILQLYFGFEVSAFNMSTY